MTKGRSGSDGRSESHRDRKSTRLNSSHLVISYAVFCLKKKKKTETHIPHTLPTNLATMPRPTSTTYRSCDNHDSISLCPTPLTARPYWRCVLHMCPLE